MEATGQPLGGGGLAARAASAQPQPASAQVCPQPPAAPWRLAAERKEREERECVCEGRLGGQGRLHPAPHPPPGSPFFSPASDLALFFPAFRFAGPFFPRSPTSPLFPSLQARSSLPCSSLSLSLSERALSLSPERERERGLALLCPAPPPRRAGPRAPEGTGSRRTDSQSERGRELCAGRAQSERARERERRGGGEGGSE